MFFRSVCEIAVTCAFAVRTSAPGLEEQFNDADAGVGVGLDMLDVVDGRGESALELRHHAAGHLGRRQAGILPVRRNDRDADFRKDVDGRARGGQRADDEKQQRKHNESVRAPQGNADQGRHEAMAPQSAPRPIAVDAATYHPRQRQISTVQRNILAFPAHTTHKYVEVLRVVSMAGRSAQRPKGERQAGRAPRS